MALINIKEIEKEIAWHEGRISALRQLMDLAPLLDETIDPQPGRKSKIAKGKPGRKPKAAKAAAPKRKRGAITEQIKTLLDNATGPVPSGAIRSALEKSGTIEKGSVTIYSQLQQMAKRGVITKTADGYTAAANPPKAKKPGRKPKAAKKAAKK